MIFKTIIKRFVCSLEKMKRINSKDKKVLITGASAGIGKALPRFKVCYYPFGVDPVFTQAFSGCSVPLFNARQEGDRR